jgi:hypothetical protein
MALAIFSLGPRMSCFTFTVSAMRRAVNFLLFCGVSRVVPVFLLPVCHFVLDARPVISVLYGSFAVAPRSVVVPLSHVSIGGQFFFFRRGLFWGVE